MSAGLNSEPRHPTCLTLVQALVLEALSCREVAFSCLSQALTLSQGLRYGLPTYRKPCSLHGTAVRRDCYCPQGTEVVTKAGQVGSLARGNFPSALHVKCVEADLMPSGHMLCILDICVVPAGEG